MTTPFARFLRVLLAGGALLAVLTASAATRIPVVFHTDIGTDIDDTWALAQILRSPELDLKLVLTDTGDTRYRAALVAKMLEIAGRTDVIIAIGEPGPIEQQPRNMEPWLKGYDLAHYPGNVRADGANALIEFVMHAPETVTLISTSAVPTLAVALAREPRLAERCRFVGMFGSVDVGYDGKLSPDAEWNVKVAPAALREVFAARWREILITPLDTCGTVEIGGEDYHRLWCATSDPLLRAVIENTCIFAGRVAWMNCDFFTQHSTTLFDCVAVDLARSQELLDVETVRLTVTDDGFTRRDPNGVPIRVALKWKDRTAWEHRFVERLLQR